MADNPSPKSGSNTTHTLINGTLKTEAMSEAALPTSEDVKTMSPPVPESEARSLPRSSSKPTTDAVMTPPRAHGPPKFSASTEANIRHMLNMARHAHQDNQFKTEEDVKELALLTTNLIQLMNASYIAKDTIVRSVAYMRGESRLPATRAIIQAKRDRRAARGDDNNRVDKAETSPQDIKNKAANSDTPKDSSIEPRAATTPETVTKGPAGNNLGSDKENTAPGAKTQPPSSGSSQTKAKKKRHWRRHRPRQGQNGVVNSKAHNIETNGTPTAVNGMTESKEDGEDKAIAAEEKQETSVEDAGNEGVAVES